MPASHLPPNGQRFRTLAAACLAITTTASVAAHAADSCGNSVAGPAAVTSQRMLDALTATNGVPGMGAAVWRNGEIVWTGCSGRRDVAAGLPVQRDTVFRLASVSKAIAHHAGVTDGARSALVLWPEGDTAASVLSNASWVSSIESTAILLAAPFLPHPPGLQSVTCPIRSPRYSGRLDKTPIEGVATFRLEHGRCVGEFVTQGALDKHFSAATAWPTRRLQVVALEADGNLARAALVTPFGLYDLRAEGPDLWSAELTPGTRLELQL